MWSIMNSKKMAVNKFGFPLWWNVFTFGFLYFIIGNTGFVEGALKDVTLLVEPPTVRRSHHATLKCIYDLNGAPLYSVKFYRGQYEFYRYTPGELPSSKTFPFPGIYVDLTVSNASQVVIRNVQFALTGNFSCEVTADAPFFSTATAFVQMQVVELPEKRPFLWTDQDRYEPGDILNANCTTPPSRPKAILKFTLNNIVMPGIYETQYNKTDDNLFISNLSLRMRLLPSHFIVSSSTAQLNNLGSANFGDQIMNFLNPSYNYNNNNNNHSPSPGSLLLRCTAQIPDFYQESSELELGGLQKDPIPARVTSSSTTRLRSFIFIQHHIYFASLAILVSSIIVGNFQINQFFHR